MWPIPPKNGVVSASEFYFSPFNILIETFRCIIYEKSKKISFESHFDAF